MNGIISPRQAMQAIARSPDIRVIDLRSADEYAQGHIKTSTNIPFIEIGDVIGGRADLNTPIILYCGSGEHSRSARQVLMYMGYKKVYDLGSVTRWPYGLVKS